ncbi:fungal-specific transcription factor domain-containing protein [Xylariales sp. PMI_506]|nr:fungal-specific transcription factor domain-containing protein [Xylariales sp. PMI_506]
MPKGGAHLNQRSMTFTGCWTCKQRKVKCDERPSVCRNCAKRGIACGGYGIRLQWIPQSHAGVERPSGHGSGRIRIGRDSGPSYQMTEIDHFLASIDSDLAIGDSSMRGPFSVFPSQEKPTEVRSVANHCWPTWCNVDNVPELASSQSPVAGNIILCSDDEPVLPESPKGTTEPLNIYAATSNWLSNIPEIPLSVTHDHDSLDDTEMEEDIGNISQSSDEEDLPASHTANTQSNAINSRRISVSLSSASASKDTGMARTAIGLFSIAQISTSLSGDTIIDNLMHHYIFHVADLLQPIRHPQNPYRNLYAPAALKVASRRNHAPPPPTETVNSVLYHSLLAASAFHMWACDPENAKHHKLGTYHRQQALLSLQYAIDSSNPPAEHQLLLMAMLSLVTIGVMSGGDPDFEVHLQGTRQLRQSRRRWSIISGTTQQLNEISDFLLLLNRTTSFQVSPLPWSDKCISGGDDDIEFRPKSCFEYMYGITPDIAAAIQETCRLAEYLSRYKANQEIIPDTLLQAAEKLGDRLFSWTLEAETVTSISPNDEEMFAVFEHHAKAWQTASIIYYFRRIQNFKVADLAEEVDRVAEHMHAVEDVKSHSKVGHMKKMAPITWPAFIASCEATRREPWERWWKRVQHYGIANIQIQWRMVQQIWDERDKMQRAGLGVWNWIEIFTVLGFNVLAI